jgi:hypothetical protein
MLQAKLFGDNDLVIKSYSSDVCHYYLSLTVMLQAKLFGDNDLVIKSYPSDVCDYYLSLNVMLQTKLLQLKWLNHYHQRAWLVTWQSRVSNNDKHLMSTT